MPGFIATTILIIEKYRSFPVISNKKFNEYLKEIGKLVPLARVWLSGKWLQESSRYKSPHLAVRRLLQFR